MWSRRLASSPIGPLSVPAATIGRAATGAAARFAAGVRPKPTLFPLAPRGEKAGQPQADAVAQTLAGLHAEIAGRRVEDECSATHRRRRRVIGRDVFKGLRSSRSDRSSLAILRFVPITHVCLDWLIQRKLLHSSDVIGLDAQSVADPPRRNGHACPFVGRILVVDHGCRRVLGRDAPAGSRKDAEAARLGRCCRHRYRPLASPARYRNRAPPITDKCLRYVFTRSAPPYSALWRWRTLHPPPSNARPG